MKNTLRLIFADLLSQKKFTLLFILNLSLGLTGFVALDSFRNHLEGSLALRSRSILGADLGMSSRHPLSKTHKEMAQKVFGNIPSSDMIETYSMVANVQGESRLIQIKAIDQQFPFYGAIKLKNQGAQVPSQVSPACRHAQYENKLNKRWRRGIIFQAIGLHGQNHRVEILKNE